MRAAVQVMCLVRAAVVARAARVRRSPVPFQASAVKGGLSILPVRRFVTAVAARGSAKGNQSLAVLEAAERVLERVAVLPRQKPA